MKFSALILAARLRLCLTQADVADRINRLRPFGSKVLSATVISHWETGRRIPRIESQTMADLLEVLGIPRTELAKCVGMGR